MAYVVRQLGGVIDEAVLQSEVRPACKFVPIDNIRFSGISIGLFEQGCE